MLEPEAWGPSAWPRAQQEASRSAQRGPASGGGRWRGRRGALAGTLAAERPHLESITPSTNRCAEAKQSRSEAARRLLPCQAGGRGVRVSSPPRASTDGLGGGGGGRQAFQSQDTVTVFNSQKVG